MAIKANPHDLKSPTTTAPNAQSIGEQRFINLLMSVENALMANLA